jgi:hypothetical protein
VFDTPSVKVLETKYGPLLAQREVPSLQFTVTAAYTAGAAGPESQAQLLAPDPNPELGQGGRRVGVLVRPVKTSCDTTEIETTEVDTAGSGMEVSEQ